MGRRSDELDTLLSEGRLGGPARERILKRVLRAGDTPTTRWRRVVLAVSTAACSATVAVVVVILVAGHRPAANDELRAKGAAATTAASIEALCGEDAGVCHPGERLFFRANASPLRRWLVAYAERADTSSPTQRIWMFPDGQDAVPEIPPSTGPSVVRRTVELGPSMPPDTYRVTFVVFDHPPTRGEAVDESARALRFTRTLVIR